MKLSKKKYSIVILLLTLSSACATGNLKYHLDPELSGVEKLSGVVSLIYVKVTDNRQSDNQTERSAKIVGPANISGSLTSSLRENFKRNNFKIITNELLADLALEFQVEELSTVLDEELFQSTISATSRIRLKANKKNRAFEKIFTNKVRQEVANPVTDVDVTGVMNQLLSKQLSAILEDPAVLQLAKK